MNPVETVKSAIHIAQSCEPSIITFPDERLRQKSLHESEFNQKLTDFAAQLTRTMVNHMGLGISAIQVGNATRVVAVVGRDGITVAVNPRITDFGDEKEYVREGCLSFPGLFFPLHRYKEVAVAFQDVTGSVWTIVAEGMEARAWQHEIDHLDGVLFIDHLAEFRKREMLAKYNKLKPKLSK